MILAPLALPRIVVNVAPTPTPSGLTRRQRVRDELASRAVAYAQQMGGSNADKLAHAAGAFRALDLADNGKRDYHDAEIRFAIEAALHRSKP